MTSFPWGWLNLTILANSAVAIALSVLSVLVATWLKTWCQFVLTYVVLLRVLWCLCQMIRHFIFQWVEQHDRWSHSVPIICIISWRSLLRFRSTRRHHAQIERKQTATDVGIWILKEFLIFFELSHRLLHHGIPMLALRSGWNRKGRLPALPVWYQIATMDLYWWRVPLCVYSSLKMLVLSWGYQQDWHEKLTLSLTRSSKSDRIKSLI